MKSAAAPPMMVKMIQKGAIMKDKGYGKQVGEE